VALIAVVAFALPQLLFNVVVAVVDMPFSGGEVIIRFVVVSSRG